MNAAEKARLARQAREQEKREKRENFRESLSDHRGWIIAAVILVIIGVLCAIFIPMIVSNYQKTLYTEDGVVYVLKNGTYSAKSVEDGQAEVTVKGEINGLPVIAIQKNFGRKSATLVKVTIETENSLEIAKKAFDNCTVLKEVVFTGGGTVSIEENAFKKCIQLKNLTVEGADVLGAQYLFDEGKAPALTITIKNGSFRQLYDTVKKVELSEGSSFGATIVGSGMVVKEFVLLDNVRGEGKFGALGFAFREKPHLIAPTYYISEKVTKIPDNFFGTEKEANKLNIYFGGTEAEWNALIATADRSTNQYFFDLGDNVTVHYGVSYEDFNNR